MPANGIEPSRIDVEMASHEAVQALGADAADSGMQGHEYR
jgi:hypothetical protein